MDKRLDKYLQSVAHELRTLPEERREEELREIRQHLEAIVARLRDGGVGEAEAVEAATAQFGHAHKVGHELVRVVPANESRARLVTAFVCSTTCYLSLNLFNLICLPLFYRHVALMGFSQIESPLGQALRLFGRLGYGAPIFLLAPLLAALVFRRIAPRSGGKAFWLFGGATCLLHAIVTLTN